MSELVGVSFAVSHVFARGAFLVEADVSAETIYLLKHGQVRVFRLDEDGREVVTAILGPGHLVGIAPLLGQDRHSAFAQATTRVEAWALPAEDVLANLAEDQTLLGLIAGGLAQRFALAAGLFRDVHLLPVLERIADIEARLATVLRGEPPALSQAALAQLVQARPETLARKRAQRRAPWCATSPAWARTPARTVSFDVGDEVFPTDLPPHQVAEVLSGAVELSLTNAGGRRIAFDTMQAGDLLGIANLVGMPALGIRAVGARAGALRVIDTAQLLTDLAEHPEQVRVLARRLAAKLEALDERLLQSVERIDERLLRCLETLDADGRDRWSHARLGAQIGVARETVTRALAQLEARGAIHRDGRRILLAVPRA